MAAAPAIITFGFHFANPCRSTLLAWWVLPECHFDDLSPPNSQLITKVLMGIMKFGLLFVNFLMYSYGDICAIFGFAAINILSVLKLYQNLQRFVYEGYFNI
ncbi:unnamed protein product [Orchesella dallaii]|uniref:Uncharacterized protein n=1 Tax=Orchesella dallaii TaxID=48710 RepID=A0ABP1RW00_9HEXA